MTKRRNRFGLMALLVLGVVAGAFVVVAFAPGALAHSWQAGEPIVPQCNTNWDAAQARFTNPCTLCDLLHLVEHIVNFIKTTVFVVAGLLVVVAGFIILTAEGSGRQKIGKEMITKVIWGIVIMLISYVAVMTFLWILLPNPTDPNTRAQFRIGIGGFEIQCNPTVRTGSGAPAGGGSGGPGGRSGARPPVVGPCTGDIEQRATSICDRVVRRATVQVALNECVQAIRTAPYDPKLLAAIIEIESGGDPNARNINANIAAGRSLLSCGVAQINVDTARLKRPGPLAGKNDEGVCNWLKENPVEAIRIGGQLLQEKALDASQKRTTHRYPDVDAPTGTDLRDFSLTAAAYNGGPGANDPSVNCAPTAVSNQVCPGEERAYRIPRWACPKDKPEGQQVCVVNTGYAVTRDYVQRVRTCFSGLRSS